MYIVLPGLWVQPYALAARMKRLATEQAIVLACFLTCAAGVSSQKQGSSGSVLEASSAVKELRLQGLTGSLALLNNNKLQVKELRQGHLNPLSLQLCTTYSNMHALKLPSLSSGSASQVICHHPARLGVCHSAVTAVPTSLQHRPPPTDPAFAFL